jgi:DNA-binding SARP family transcriptional activator/tetratricopeptide (TPR) repeat protein
MVQVGENPNIGSAAKPKLSLFGRSNIVEIDEARIRLPRLSVALCAFLLLDCPDHQATRESAGQFLWEELRSGRQAGNMRQLMLRLRRIAPPNGSLLFETCERSDALALRTCGLEIDVCLFQAACAARTEQGIATICRVYAGDLLSNLHEKGERLNAWLATKRATLRRQFVDAITSYLEGGKPPASSDIATLAAKKLVEIEPLQEVGYRALMKIYWDGGDRESIRDMHRALERELARASGAKPSPMTCELRDALLAKPWPTTNLRDHPSMAPSPNDVVRTSRVAASRDVGRPSLGIMAYAPRAASRVDHSLFDELAHALATRMAQTRTMTVRASWTEPPRETSAIFSTLDYVLVLRSSSVVSPPTVSLRLVETSTLENLWAATLRLDDCRPDSVKTVLGSILRHVEDRERQKSSLNPEMASAYRIVLGGHRLLRTIELPSIRKARGLFKAALIVNSDYVAALAGLARTHVMEWLVRAPFERGALDTAEQIAKRALSIDPDDHRGHHELGVVNMYLKRLDDSVACLASAKRLSPDDIAVRADLADALIFNGQVAEAMELVNDFKPLPASCDDYLRWIMASVYFDRDDYGSSLHEIGMMGNPAPAFRLCAAAHAIRGDREQARQVRRASMEFNPDFNLSSWLSLVPSRNRDCVRRYTEGLRLAGFV